MTAQQIAAVATAIRTEADSRGWTAVTLARQTGITAPTARLVLAGRKKPRVATLWRVARAMGLDGVLPSAEMPRDPSRRETRGTTIATACDARDVDLHAARHTLRRLSRERLSPAEAVMVEDIARSLGLPADWAARPLAEYEP